MSVTISKLANKLNVSTATVSKSLRGVKGVNKSTANRVCSLARELGYKPNVFARGLRSKKSGVVGFLLTTELTNSWFSELVHVIEAQLRERKINLILGIGNRDESREIDCLDVFSGSFLDAVIVGPILDYKDYRCLESKIHCSQVVSFACSEDIPVDHVKINHIAGVKKAISCFVEHGHKRIGYLCCTERTLRQSGITRKAGFDEAMMEYGLPIYGNDIVIGKPTFESGFKNMSKLIDERYGKLPTAFFCHNDEVALGAINALHSKGLSVPGDISLIGYDGIASSEFAIPPLTTVGGQMESLAGNIVRLLLENTHKLKREIRAFVVEPELIVRQTVKRLK